MRKSMECSAKIIFRMAPLLAGNFILFFVLALRAGPSYTRVALILCFAIVHVLLACIGEIASLIAYRKGRKDAIFASIFFAILLAPIAFVVIWVVLLQIF